MASRTHHQACLLRIYYAGAVFLSIAFGLASRTYEKQLPSFAALHAGDALWAMMVYFSFRFLLATPNIHAAVCLAFAFSFSIEFSQLYQAEWIVQLRGTVPGALVLGHGFLVIDLLRYTAGIFAAAALDKLLFRFPRLRSRSPNQFP